MGFSIHRMANHNSTTKEEHWAVIFDHEHILFVGTYRQCEEWLDWIEGTEVYGRRTLESQQESTPKDNANWKRSISEWLSNLMDSFRQHRASQRLLLGTEGHFGEVQSVVAAVIFITMYASSIIAYWNVGSDRPTHDPQIPATSIITRATIDPISGDRCTDYGLGNLDIACDFAPPRN